MKTHFCDDCIREILTTVEDEFIDEAVIYDAEEKTFYPVTEGDLQIGDYSFHTYEQLFRLSAGLRYGELPGNGR